MNRQQKTETINELRQNFDQSPATFVVGVKGLTVGQTQALRQGLREKNSRLKIAKVRLMKRALEGLEGIDGLSEHMREQLGVVFANEEPSQVARTLRDFAKENQALQLVAGFFESEVLDAAGVKEVASLPSRDELLAMVAGTLKELIARYARALQAVADKKAAEGEGGSTESAPAEEAPAESEAPAAEEKAEEPAESEAPHAETTEAETTEEAPAAEADKPAEEA